MEVAVNRPMNSPIPKVVDTRFEVAMEALVQLIGISSNPAGAERIRRALTTVRTGVTAAEVDLDAEVARWVELRRTLHPDDADTVTAVLDNEAAILKGLETIQR